MRSSYRRRIRIARFRKNKRKMRQLFRLSIFENARADELLQRTIPKMVVLTGAGISAESGIQTFRAEDGLWEDHRVEDVATPEGFMRDPDQVHRFYNDRRRHLISSEVTPNPAHHALAKLAARLGDNLLLVTQNIDNLHEKAGSTEVVHMHGELLKVRCTQSQQVISWQGDLSSSDHCTCCQFPAPLRPHIVWFGEIPLHMDTIQQAIADCDIFVAIGTSGQVYPAAGFVHEARLNNAYTVELNLEPTQSQQQFIERHYGYANQTVPRWVDSLLEQKLVT